MKHNTQLNTVKKSATYARFLLALAASLLGFSGVSHGFEANLNNGFSDFWVTESPTSQQYSANTDRVSIQTQLVQKNADRPNGIQYQDQYVSTFLSANNAEGQGLSLLSRYSDNEYSTAVEAYVGRFSFAGTKGRGERFSRITGDYSGIDPYAFHGGNRSDFSYQGFSMGYRLAGQHHVQFGRSVVKADSLEDRTADYIDYSNNRFFARYTQVARGADKVGYGMDFGMHVGQFDVAYQRLSSRYDVSTERVRLQWNKSIKNQFGLELAQHRNALLNAHEDQRMMLTWRHTLGGSAPVFMTVDQSEANTKKKKTGVGRGIILGGAAAAALVLSSGSSDQDETERVMPEGNGLVRNVQAQHDAARQRLNRINPVSVRENREYGGYIFQSADGSYGSTNPIRGEAASVSLPIPSAGVPVGTTATASYHTHAAFDPRFDNENFSPTDLAGDREFDIDGYLGTPGGRFKYHEVSTGAISTLGTINN